MSDLTVRIVCGLLALLFFGLLTLRRKISSENDDISLGQRGGDGIEYALFIAGAFCFSAIFIPGAAQEIAAITRA
jgi:hypothetical protein